MIKILVTCLIFKISFLSTTLLASENVYSNELLNDQLRYKRVVGGLEGDIKNFPYLASISYSYGEPSVRVHICGGSIISHNMILTAAHCTNYKRSITKTFKVRVGSTYWNKMGNVIDVKEIIQHKDFNSITYKNDISVLILSISLEFNEYINYIKIGRELRLHGTYGTVIGWGLLYENAKNIPQIFNTVDVPLVNTNVCTKIYSSVYVHDGVICAGYYEGGKDACIYDSGGPLIENNEIIGIISLGIGCARPNRPGIYTDVVYFNDWIDDKLRQYSN